MRKTKSYRLDEATDSLLSFVDNPGRYLDAIVQRSWKRCTYALNLLLLSGWTNEEICEAISALNSVWEITEDTRFHSASMSRYDPGGITCERWDIMKNQVANDHRISIALDTVAAEYWCGNDRLRLLLTSRVEEETAQ